MQLELIQAALSLALGRRVKFICPPECVPDRHGSSPAEDAELHRQP